MLAGPKWCLWSDLGRGQSPKVFRLINKEKS